MKKKISIFAVWCTLISFISCSDCMYKGLITWEEYYRCPRDKPYILELCTEEGSLVYYGAFHTVNPRSPQLSDMEKRWKEFQPTLAFSEGGIWPLEKSRKKAIRKYGEQGLLRFIAARDGVPIKSFEPCRQREALYLLKYFSPNQIKIFYVLRQAVINRKMRKNMGNVDYVNRILRDLSKITQFKYPPYSLADFETEIYQIFPYLKDWRLIPESWFSSKDTGNWTNEMSRFVNDFRNQNMLKVLISTLKKGERIFAIAGRSHVVMQEPVLHSAIGNILSSKIHEPESLMRKSIRYKGKNT